MKNNDNNTYLILTITLFVSLLIPTLVQDGMFFDGVTYSAISKNMANGYGSIWEPHYTKVLYPSFYEHPPLVFIVESLFFRLFGNGFYTERIFCLFVSLLSVFGIIKCWKLLADNSEMKTYYWLPILFWLAVPIISWSYKNNLLENTMGVFSIYAVYFILKALKESKIIFMFLASILIIMAFLSKGVVGIFPLVTPLLFGMIFHQNKKSFGYFSVLIVMLLFVGLLLIQFLPEMVNNITKYFEQQLLPALNNKREITTNNRFKIILDLIFQLAIPLVFVFYFLFKKHKITYKDKIFSNKNFILFILIAISASIPLIVSLKQRKFYLIPSIPFYALAFSTLIYQFIKEGLDKVSALTLTRLNQFSFLILAVVLIFSTFKHGAYSRDEAKLSDVYIISKYIPEGTIMSTTENLCSDWSLIAYLSRIGYISIDSKNGYEYFLIDKKSENIVSKEYKPIDLKLQEYIILKKNTE